MSAVNLTQRARDILREILGDEARFHAGQLEAILACVRPGGHTLVVQRTGWGKSLVYFIAARLLKEQGRGVTLLISPLLSLMRNQLEAAQRAGVRAKVIHSANDSQHKQIFAAVMAGEVDLLMVAPERLENRAFMTGLWQTYLRQKCALLVIDEAHCISDWGHDFRLSYRRIRSLMTQLDPSASVLGTTATANQRVTADIQTVLGVEMRVVRGALARDSLQLFTIREVMGAGERLAMLHQILTRKTGSGIIYCLTTRDCEQVAGWLKQHGHAVEPYYADIDSDLRIDLEQRLLNNEVKALVASVALGMGFDKPDLAFVVHYQMPGSIVAYYQQVGRAGRNLQNALILLMHGYEDDDINSYFINTAFPKHTHVREVVKQLRAQPEMALGELLRRVNAPRDKVLKVLTHLELGGLIEQNGGEIRLIDLKARARFRHWKEVKARRVEEYEGMKRYLAAETCLMRFITQALDDHTAPAECGRCQVCTGHDPKFDLATSALIPQAEAFLRPQRPLMFELHKRRPPGKEFELANVIPKQITTGMALAKYNEPPYGRMVYNGKYVDLQFSAALAYQSARWILDFAEEFWDVKPTWVTAVPSRRHPLLVADFARRLADVLSLPYHPTLVKTEDSPQQKLMENSGYQLRNLVSSVAVDGDVLPQPVLLVDDITDSHWTLTYCAALLESEGCSAVLPFALASADKRG